MSYKYKFKPHRKKTIGKREFPVKIVPIVCFVVTVVVYT